MQNIVYTVVKYTGPKFFSRQLPGYSLLIPEFIEAANTVLSSDDLGPVSIKCIIIHIFL